MKDPIREAQSMAVVLIERLMLDLRATPNELLLSLADLPIADSEDGTTIEAASQHVKDAAVRFRQLAKLFLNLKQEIRKIYPDAH